MTQQNIRRLVGAAILAPLALALAAGCTGGPVSPLPGEPNPTTAAPSPSGSIGPSASSSAQPPSPSVSRPASPGNRSSSSARPPVEPDLPPSCLGPVVYSVDTDDSAERTDGLCIEVGGTFQVRGVVPGDPANSAEPEELVSCWYEAGISSCLLRRPGNLTVTAGHGEDVRTYEILIIAGR